MNKLKRSLLIIFLLCSTLAAVAQKRQKKPILGDTTVHTTVDVLPLFGSSQRDLGIFLSKNIVYPDSARRNNLEGRVILTFVVEKNGALNQISVIRGVGSQIDAEAVRVLKLSPKWHAGMIKGKPVRTLFSVPIHFALSK